MAQFKDDEPDGAAIDEQKIMIVNALDKYTSMFDKRLTELRKECDELRKERDELRDNLSDVLKAFKASVHGRTEFLNDMLNGMRASTKKRKQSS
jgi:uncharacterized coiled-coil DUF342 family protein